MSALFNRQARGILRALSESSPVLSLLSTKSLKFSAAAATSQQWSTCTKNQVRFYSPRQIRRNGPQGYDNRQYNDDQYSYEEPKVTYSYPNSSPSFSSAGYLQYSDPLVDIISQPCLVMERQVEFMNLFLGFEQANRYAIMDIQGNHLGYMEEEDFGLGKVIMRQVTRLHRPFSVRVLDRQGQHVMTIQRPFSFINSRIKAILPSRHDNDPIIIGESKQQWHLWRRRYNLFLNNGNDSYDQFGAVDAPFLSFTFNVMNEENKLIGAVDRNWVGFGRELFTDTGVYILKMDPSTFNIDNGPGFQINPEYLSSQPLSLDQRAVLLTTAVSIDFDYFSRHSRPGG